MYVLTDQRCEGCGHYVQIVPVTKLRRMRIKQRQIVSHGECLSCGLRVVLPAEEYASFLHRRGISLEGNA